MCNYHNCFYIWKVHCWVCHTPLHLWVISFLSLSLSLCLSLSLPSLLMTLSLGDVSMQSMIVSLKRLLARVNHPSKLMLLEKSLQNIVVSNSYTVINLYDNNLVGQVSVYTDSNYYTTTLILMVTTRQVLLLMVTTRQVLLLMVTTRQVLLLMVTTSKYYY